ncbi:cytochrome c, class I [Nitrobacter sp. Nb-311A]|uniref:c-type cytochrome n=1 Tax=unclassified Nitrobacter TaxID=2620411 RepID=UPI0000686030|nr:MULTISPECIES: cytochrome c family protein [unclassified Nitrobacter]EAQ36549.1 cytochrome c, class I [Nitrobacter sp. Nb-311A]MCB1392739.1 cytochrome c family protein [Nitrobacter sp.]MCV0385614.1 cytochrome c family protein [Nitrobacter sp.]
MKTFVISALTVLGVTLASVGPSSAGDVEAGKSSFNKCKACHEIGEGAKNKVGPELNGLDGRHAGSLEGYAYSDAMKKSGITWNQAEFEEYIKNPKAKVPGVKMVFAGIKKQSELDNLWAYVSQFDKDGKIKAK